MDITFDIPDINEDETQVESGRSLHWDFDTGDFVRDGTNRIIDTSRHDAYIQWCIKMIHTERYTCLSYPEEIGTETTEIKEANDRETEELMFERTISEALMIHPATEYVSDFEFIWDADNLYISFTVKAVNWDEKTEIKTSFNRG